MSAAAKRTFVSSALFLDALLCVLPSRAQTSLDEAYHIIASKTFVDLTHAFGPDTPVWSGFGQARMSPAIDPKTHKPYTIEKDGFRATYYEMAGQYGTHIDPPAHFAKDGITMDKIPLEEMILPLVVFDATPYLAADPNNAFSHAVKTVSPARSSIHDNAGGAAIIGCEAGASADALRSSGPNPRMVAATAMPTATSVMTVNAPLATDFSARTSVMRTMIPKNPAAAKVSHIGKVGERQSWSSDVAQAQFMRDVPQRRVARIPRKPMPALFAHGFSENGSANGAF